MRWNKYIKQISRYVNFVLYKLSTILDPKPLNVIYQVLFESIINYGLIAWDSAYDNATKPFRIIKKFKGQSILSIVYCELCCRYVYIITKSVR